VQWLAEGDKNTKFFHHKANYRRKKNKIERLVRPNGTVCENAIELEEMAHDFYEDLYKSKGTIGIEEGYAGDECRFTRTIFRARGEECFISDVPY
jgi:hypothetical protein